MEMRIATAVIQAVKNTQTERMETSSCASLTDTNSTTKAFTDRFNPLTLIVQNLAAQVTALTEAQETNFYKRQ
jgi:hypothetical protein